MAAPDHAKPPVQKNPLAPAGASTHAHEGLKGAIRRVMGPHASWQRCSVGLLIKPALAFDDAAVRGSAAYLLESRSCRCDFDGLYRGSCVP